MINSWQNLPNWDLSCFWLTAGSCLGHINRTENVTMLKAVLSQQVAYKSIQQNILIKYHKYLGMREKKIVNDCDHGMLYKYFIITIHHHLLGVKTFLGSKMKSYITKKDSCWKWILLQILEHWQCLGLIKRSNQI